MTSYSGLWNNEFGENYSALSDSERVGNTKTALARVFAQRLYGRSSVRELLYALIGSAAGGNAAATHKRVKAESDVNSNVLGGSRTIETHSAVDRVTTADDVTDLKAALHLSPAPSYPTDKSGNGGGSKLGW